MCSENNFEIIPTVSTSQLVFERGFSVLSVRVVCPSDDASISKNVQVLDRLHGDAELGWTMH